ncbi:MAG TPA: GxxExxY protein [Chthoniobacteraceae bacterium]|jgi:GxxExxY protein
MPDLLYKDESYQIMGACFEVYREKGCGFVEHVYHECLAFEFQRKGIPAISKPRLQLEYKGMILAQHLEPDWLCFGEIIVELKAVVTLTAEHRAQIKNYLKATGKRLGLLVNFADYPKIEWERHLHDDGWTPQHQPPDDSPERPDLRA